MFHLFSFILRLLSKFKNIFNKKKEVSIMENEKELYTGFYNVNGVNHRGLFRGDAGLELPLGDTMRQLNNELEPLESTIKTRGYFWCKTDVASADWSSEADFDTDFKRKFIRTLFLISDISDHLLVELDTNFNNMAMTRTARLSGLWDSELNWDKTWYINAYDTDNSVSHTSTINLGYRDHGGIAGDSDQYHIFTSGGYRIATLSVSAMKSVILNNELFKDFDADACFNSEKVFPASANDMFLGETVGFGEWTYFGLDMYRL